MTKGLLSVSLMCADLLNIERIVKAIDACGTDFYHVDIMDSLFVPNLTFGPDFVNALKRITKTPLDIHLLMEYPSVIIRSLNIDASDIVTIHSECKENILENIAFIKQRGARFGLALNPNTPVESVENFLPYTDMILQMLITPGFAGTTIIHGMKEKVAAIRQYLHSLNYDHIMLGVDGSVSCGRAKQLKAMGATLFVGGSTGIFIKGKELVDTINAFRRAIDL